MQEDDERGAETSSTEESIAEESTRSEAAMKNGKESSARSDTCQGRQTAEQRDGELVGDAPKASSATPHSVGSITEAGRSLAAHARCHQQGQKTGKRKANVGNSQRDTGAKQGKGEG